MITHERVGPVWVLHFESGDNRFNDDFLNEFNDLLDRIEGSGWPTALVTTGAGKFYSNGLDLEWLGSAPEPDAFMDRVHELFLRVLTFPAATVAAVNGHAFAAGAMLATAHDFVIMRSDRGYWCLPEVDLGLPLTPTMYALLQARLSRVALHEALTTGRRYDAQAMLEVQIAHEIVPEGVVLSRAIELAMELSGKDHSVVAIHKQLMYADVIATNER
ncbi:MAG: enoyl-CoA hydratase/isomerase family protein [Acidimicrobiales bacterium]|jgi:enoyl-CoA hydratase/carnithine racemase